MRTVEYNSQRNNFNFAGKFPGSVQCFATCAWMLICWAIGFGGSDDVGLKEYADQVEATVGNPGIGEKIARKFSWIKGRTSYWCLTQQAGIEEYLKSKNVLGKCQYVDKGSWENFLDALKISPVILHTSQLGGLPGGHMILAVDTLAGADGVSIVCNDPYGDAGTNYRNENGYTVLYSEKILRASCEKAAGGSIRFMYWKGAWA